ncbi:DUF3307 domain-containing protein [Pseudidiomarina gelatinasegens]|uniref:DUF3307 domain-containing protein n=1 Tax=Pseudidiomarina gelatinasegens TaxID=2487740 RepID=UPI003A9848CC
MNELIFLVSLVLGHVLGDFYLQPSAWVTDKVQKHYRSLMLVAHALVHGTLAFFVFLIFTDTFDYSVVGLALFVAITHYFIDLVKSYFKPKLMYFLIDQLSHILILIICWLLVTEQLFSFSGLLEQVSTEYLVITFAAYLLVMKPASVFISLLLRPLIEKLNTEKAEEGETSLETAGRLIGNFERVIILTLLFLNEYAAIGFVLAAKSVFRFGDLQDRRSRGRTEYVLLGTFVSMAVVLLIGLIATGLHGLL